MVVPLKLGLRDVRGCFGRDGVLWVDERTGRVFWRTMPA